MYRHFYSSLVLGVTLLCSSYASAQSCYDLWYARNLFYKEQGFCFSTKLAKETFGNQGCWTKNPEFSREDQRVINEIRALERAKQCRVN